jgi:4,4'-diaponeurosporenoate glycosyltransferase
MIDLLAAAIVAAALLLGHRLGHNLRTLPETHPSEAPSGASAMGVAVVVPARNEETTLPTLLSSLAHQRATISSITVVDDNSTDRTAEVAGAAGATVLNPGTPPTSWTGKAWACHRGASATEEPLLLFLDADTCLAPDALDRLLSAHRDQGGLVSVQPFHETRRPHEQLSAYFNAVATLGSGLTATTSTDQALAFGPCLLTSRTGYDLAGGHTAARQAVLDDVVLGEAYQRVGLPVTTFIGGTQIQMRSYPTGVRQLFEGWSKNIASAATSTPPIPRAITTLWITAHHLAAVMLATSAVNAITSGAAITTLLHLAGWLTGYAFVALQLRATLARIGRFAPWAWLLYPVPMLFFDLVVGVSAVQTFLTRSVRWRGRAIPGDSHQWR